MYFLSASSHVFTSFAFSKNKHQQLTTKRKHVTTLLQIKEFHIQQQKTFTPYKFQFNNYGVQLIMVFNYKRFKNLFSVILNKYKVKVVKLATVVEGDQKAPFSIATTPRCRGDRYSFPWIAPLYP